MFITLLENGWIEVFYTLIKVLSSGVQKPVKGDVSRGAVD